MKLYLMRHGEAASENIDPQQGLTTGGRAAIERLAQRLATRGIQFAQIFHSEKERARQSAEIMARILVPGIPLQQHPGLKPNDDARQLLPELEGWQQDTLITSHLPFIPNLLALLIGELQSLAPAPGTVVCLENETRGWQINWVESP